MGDFQVDYGQSLFMCILYITIGTISIICSLTTITLYLSSRDLRRKYLLYMVLDICELIDAVSYVLLGTGRGHLLLNGFLGTSISVRDCFFTRYWPHSLILGTQLPSICTLFLSFERIMAVIRPATYKRACTQNFKLVLVAMVPVWAMLTLIAAGLSVVGSEGDRVVGTKHCAIITSTSKWYSTFHFTFVVLAYVISFVSTLIVWATRRVWRNLTNTKFGGSQDDKLSMILAMSGTSIILLASPAVVMLTIRWDITEWGDIEVAVTYAMPGFLSVVNTIIAFRFRKELRAQLWYILGFKTIHPNHLTEPSMFTRTTVGSRKMTIPH